MTVNAPFRWDMSSAEVARRVGRGLRAAVPGQMKESLLRCAVRVLLAAGDADLVFVGRSPESIYDFLSGAFAGTPARERLQLLQLSLGYTPSELRQERPGALGRLFGYLEALALSPARILDRPRPVAFVDLVWSGTTFGNLTKVLRFDMGREPRRWHEVRERLRWICLVPLESDFTPWRPEDSRWTREFASEHVRRLLVDARFWHYLGDEQEKTTASYTAAAWGSERRESSLEEERFSAVRMARAVFRLGECWRLRLAAELERAGPPEPWLLELARALRSLSRSRS